MSGVGEALAASDSFRRLQPGTEATTLLLALGTALAVSSAPRSNDTDKKVLQRNKATRTPIMVARVMIKKRLGKKENKYCLVDNGGNYDKAICLRDG